MSFQWSALRLSLPLLGKELTELAARKRTYAVRVIFALALFSFFLLQLYSLFQSNTHNPFAIIGHGDELFTTLVGFQFVAIYLLLPAMMAGVITSEKERDALPLLFLTGMHPWKILAQKYLGRLIPMFSLLLLTLPLLAVAYALGGVSPDAVASGFYLLALACLQVGAFALMASAFFQTTTGAVVFAYLGLAGISFLPAIITMWLRELQWIPSQITADMLLLHLPPFVFSSTKMKPFGDILFESTVIGASIIMFLLASLIFLRIRSSSQRRLIAWPKRIYLYLNEFCIRMTGGRKKRDNHDVLLLKDDPIAWREHSKGALGGIPNLLLVLVLVDGVVLLFMVFGIEWTGYANVAQSAATVLIFLLFGLSALVATVQGVNSIATERSNQTLEVLACTPLTGEEIIRQKSRAQFRLWIIFAIALLALIMLELWSRIETNAWSFTSSWRRRSNDEMYPLQYLFLLGAATVIYLPTCSWFGFWIGQQSRDRGKAVLFALSGLVCWMFLPVVLGVITNFAWDRLVRCQNNCFTIGDITSISLLSPATLVYAVRTQSPDYLRVNYWGVWFMVNLLFHFGVFLFFRWRCITRADRYLGRG